MNLKHTLRQLHGRATLPWFMLCNRGKQRFECPICGYRGPFKDVRPASGLRKHARCPRCSAMERHRLLYLVVGRVLNDMDCSAMKMLHFAPEPFFSKYFSARFGRYETADLYMRGVDHKVDLQALPFEDRSYDFVFASHVLEHVVDDDKALSEIRRILKPGGVALLPVPIVAEKTIEYPEPNPKEFYHVRAPGYDYFDRYDRHFTRVERIGSDSLADKYQLYIYEDRTRWPTEACPLRPAMPGERHVDVVPVCYV